MRRGQEFNDRVENAPARDQINIHYMASPPEPEEGMTAEHCRAWIARLREERRIVVTSCCAGLGLLGVAAMVGYPQAAVCLGSLAGMIALGTWGNLMRCRIDHRIRLYRIRQRELMEAQDEREGA